MVRSYLQKSPLENLTLRTVIEGLKLVKMLDNYSDFEIDTIFNVGQIIDSVLEINEIRNLRDREISYHITIGELIDKVGEQRVKDYVIEKTSTAANVPEYAHNKERVFSYWWKLGLFILGFGLVSAASVLLLMKRKR